MRSSREGWRMGSLNLQFTLSGDNHILPSSFNTYVHTGSHLLLHTEHLNPAKSGIQSMMLVKVVINTYFSIPGVARLRKKKRRTQTINSGRRASSKGVTAIMTVKSVEGRSKCQLITADSENC